MATEFGTATNHADLVERLVQFLTANTTLVAAGQAYEKVFDNTIPASGTAIAIRQVTLRAPGLGGEDSIFMGVQSYGDTALDYYNVRLMGGTAFNPGALPPGGDFWTAFVNYSPRVQLLGWNQPMPYWFFANGRRFWIVVKVSTIYESAGAGFILPPCPAGAQLLCPRPCRPLAGLHRRIEQQQRVRLQQSDPSAARLRSLLQ